MPSTRTPALPSQTREITTIPGLEVEDRFVLGRTYPLMIPQGCPADEDGTRTTLWAQMNLGVYEGNDRFSFDTRGGRAIVHLRNIDVLETASAHDWEAVDTDRLVDRGRYQIRIRIGTHIRQDEAETEEPDAGDMLFNSTSVQGPDNEIESLRDFEVMAVYHAIGMEFAFNGSGHRLRVGRHSVEIKATKPYVTPPPAPLALLPNQIEREALVEGKEYIIEIVGGTNVDLIDPNGGTTQQTLASTVRLIGTAGTTRNRRKVFTFNAGILQGSIAQMRVLTFWEVPQTILRAAPNPAAEELASILEAFGIGANDPRPDWDALAQDHRDNANFRRTIQEAIGRGQGG